MFGPSKDKVCRKIDALISELAVLEPRISHHEDEYEFTVQSGIALPGEDEFISLWRKTYSFLMESLPKVQQAIIAGDEDHKKINRLLPLTQRQIQDLGAAISDADSAEVIGKKRANDFFKGLK